MFRFTPVVSYLLVVNFAVYIGAELFGLRQALYDQFALYYIESNNFKAWQFVTYMFLHGDFGHVFWNMIGLWIFGTWLEDVWGGKRFLQYYLIAGIGAAVIFMGVEYLEKSSVKREIDSFLFQPNPNDFELIVSEHFREIYAANYHEINPVIRAYAASPQDRDLEIKAVDIVRQLRYTMFGGMLGASGALYGIMIAAGLLFPYRQILLFFVIPVPSRILIFFYGAYELYVTLQRAPNDDIAHMAHLGGALVGYIVLLTWGEAQRRYQ